jgi:hypothetical protein
LVIPPICSYTGVMVIDHRPTKITESHSPINKRSLILLEK